jgi:glycopeptide antibiotics resistance protein
MFENAESTETSGVHQPQSPFLFSSRYRFLVAIAIAYMVLCVIALLMPLPFRGRFWYRVADLLHIPAFGILNFFALVITRQHTKSPWMAPGLITLVTIGLSGVLELIQGMLTRYASLDDLFRNSLGALAALLVFKALELRFDHRKGQSRGLVIAALIAILLGTLRPTAAIVDLYRQKMQFPVLATFATRTELQRWYVGSAKLRRTRVKWLDGSYALRVDYLPGHFPAIQLQEPPPDWSSYKTLVTPISHLSDSPSPSIVIQLRIADRRAAKSHDHGIFERIELKRGQTIQWRFDFQAAQAAQAEPDRVWLDEVAFVEFMAVEPAEKAVVQFGRIWLQP